MLVGQLDLFALAAGPAPTPAQRRAVAPPRSTKPSGYAKPPGSGPKGETCRSCANIRRIESQGRRVFRKCELMRAHWTRGPGSDIKASAPACSLWEKQT